MQNNRHLLFCFPFAGGTADFYNPLEKECGSGIQFIKLEYPGHGLRRKESLCDSFEKLTSDLLPLILNTLKSYEYPDYSLMGYSMGSIALFDVLRNLIECNEILKPKHIFLAAHQPSPIRTLKEIPENELDTWVKKRTIEFGGVDEKLLDNKIFWRVYLPVFKNDYKMIANYNFYASTFFTQIPATIFYSETDTPFLEMKEWDNFFKGECGYIAFSGSHFFIREHYSEMAKIIRNKTVGDIGV